MTWLIGLALKAGVPQRWAKGVTVAVLLMLAVAAFFGAKALYDRSVIEDHVAGQELKQEKRERKADANLEQQKGSDEAAAEQRREEIDNATRSIPDKAPSARQRARACLELRRQAKAAGRREPAC